ncbi:PBP1A family penicillin-binding protein [Flagellatimonas centrodinii]|uniref:penicillin-binding protein 1A n=1 Tax=Flagellatimonas centrodinii TaxID=2806210 RepID=UPI001FEFA2A3|nr:PBP1A family penicillin-binding protein [Flagellatimonas centrodinii]ULQ47861.1 PBP1A family penicillin-binding protein [Flagellatimonas centrodinii]
MSGGFRLTRGWGLLVSLLAGLTLIVLATAGVVVQQVRAGLPPVDSLRELQLSEPLRVYARDGQLIGEFGSERRALLRFDQLPRQLIGAFVAAEDQRFFAHGGIDLMGLARAAVNLIMTGEKAQGGSTITMQLARNVFLSSEKTYTRKFREILLAQAIEAELDKSEILELYLNKIYLGERAYGVGAAARVYFNADVEALSLSQAATLAGLPKAPSRDNPIANPERARDRRDYVLGRMHDAGFIDAATLAAARAEPMVVSPYRPTLDVDAHYAVEMVRALVVERFGEAAYTDGLRVITTLDGREQAAAVMAVRDGLMAYEERHGWRGPEQRLDTGDPAQWDAALTAGPRWAELVPAVVTAIGPEEATLHTLEGEQRLPAAGWAWAKLDAKRALQRGDLIRIRRSGDRWRLAQVPEAQAAFVALDPANGEVRALVGGYDFFAAKFNRVVQARRQAGSSFKPFLYAAALQAGFTPASVVLDAPVVFDDPALESTWRPQNYSGKFYGPTRLREALVHSRNLVSIRLLQAVGFDQARQTAAAFGLPIERLPRDLTMALGSAVFTPMEMAQAFGSLANGGYEVVPRLILRVETLSGEVLWSPPRVEVCTACDDPEARAALPPDLRAAAQRVPAPVAWLVADMLRDVTRRGTGAKVRELGRDDLGGKTGTTNDETDAWFAGFNTARVGVAWVGFDQPRPLGRGEVGGRAALPIWMDYMRVALKDVPERIPPPPADVVSVRIDPETGLLARPGDPDARFEYVQRDHLPDASPTQAPASAPGGPGDGVGDLF